MTFSLSRLWNAFRDGSKENTGAPDYQFPEHFFGASDKSFLPLCRLLSKCTGSKMQRERRWTLISRLCLLGAHWCDTLAASYRLYVCLCVCMCELKRLHHCVRITFLMCEVECETSTYSLCDCLWILNLNTSQSVLSWNSISTPTRSSGTAGNLPIKPPVPHSPV